MFYVKILAEKISLTQYTLTMIVFRYLLFKRNTFDAYNPFTMF